MNAVHPHISDVDQLWNQIQGLWLFMTTHYHWLTHTYANHKHLKEWRLLASLLTNLDKVLAYQPVVCGALCGI